MSIPISTKSFPVGVANFHGSYRPQEAPFEISVRIEQALERAISAVEHVDAPPGLAAAMRYAVFPGGGRIRPRLCLTVAAACGENAGDLALGTAAAIELLHCASLVHDDLPCFDNAVTRRGRPSVHHAFGERLALLAGDALITLAFQTLAQSTADAPMLLGPMVLVIAGAAGMPIGIAAGQAWEAEQQLDLRHYHRTKTGSLFWAATMGGALAAGFDGAPWRYVGELLGEAYQVADDIKDIVGSPDHLGKPIGQDAIHGRPNASSDLGLEGAVFRLRCLIRKALATIPACPGRAEIRSQILLEVRQMVRSGAAARCAVPPKATGFLPADGTEQPNRLAFVGDNA